MRATAVRTTLPLAQLDKRKRSHALAWRYAALVGSLAVTFIVHFAIVRPWYTNWGATPYEQTRALPGDQFVTNGSQSTHAITINAPSTLVWKWVAQLGQDRGGFYSYDLLENIIGAKMPTSDYLRPNKQSWKAGDRLWMYPPQYNIAVSGAPLQTYIPGRAIGFATMQNVVGDSSWNFYLEPIDKSHTRLIIRSKAARETSVAHFAFNALIFDQAHFAMEKRTMIGIKQLAEGNDRGRIANHVQVGLWTITFALWILLIIYVLRRKEWLRPLIAFVAASALFQILSFGQPSVWLGAILVSSLMLLMWWPISQPSNPGREAVSPA